MANFTNYEFVSLGITAAFFTLMVLYTHFGPNWILLRVATGSAAANRVAGAGHWLTWLSMFAVYLRHGNFGKDWIKGGYVMGAFDSTHEILWYVFYLVANPARITIIAKYYFPFVVFVGAILFGWLLNFQKETMPKKKIAFAIGFGLVLYSLWLAGGFHISIDTYSGNTNFYPSLDVNLEEDDSWVLYALTWL